MDSDNGIRRKKQTKLKKKKKIGKVGSGVVLWRAYCVPFGER